MIKRDVIIDILRGFAILIMIGANMLPCSLLESENPLWIRFYSSLAAPMFVLLAGMMVSYTMNIKGHKFQYYFKRGLIILLVAALIDVTLWRITPFCSFDVLYIIGISTMIIFFFNRLNTAAQIIIILAIFIFTPFLQLRFGYNTASPVMPQIFSDDLLNKIISVPSLHQLFIDGWFPIFPWLAVALLGAFIGSYKLKIPEKKFNQNILISGIILFLIGISFWIYFNPQLAMRDGYRELFYPPTLYFFATYLGAIFILMVGLNNMINKSFLNFLTIYGRSSLLAYISHIIFIVFILTKISAQSLTIFLFLYMLHALIIWIICKQAQKIKKDNLSLGMKIILGS